MEGRAEEKGRRKRPFIAWVLGVVLIPAVPVFLWLFTSETNVRPDLGACPALRETDDLLHLARQSTEPKAIAQLNRWEACDPARQPGGRTIIAQARHTLVPYDAALIATDTVVLLLAALVMRRLRRWRFASGCGIVLTLAYAVADVGEDLLLDQFLKNRQWSTLLPISSAVKLGSAFAALPLLVGAVFVLFSGEPTADRADDAPRRTNRFFTRWARRLRLDYQDPAPVGVDEPSVPRPARAPKLGRARKALLGLVCGVGRWMCGTACGPDETDGAVRPAAKAEAPPGLGVCCSGGGIRSAAFSLGALQAMDEPPEGNGVAELSRARWLFSVSGGSYIAAAWVTARAAAAKHGAAPRKRTPWSRRSYEEQFLRQHASYLAPGLAGKAWALLWFLLAFAANAGLVVLTIGAVFLPIGWAIHTGVERRPVQSGVLGLPAGGCIELAGGAFLTAVAGTQLHLSPGSRAVLTGGVVEKPPTETVKSKATATAEGSPPLAAIAVVGAQATTTSAPDTGTPPPTPAGAPATVSCPPDPASGEVPGAPQADAVGGFLKKGTKVPILAGPRLGVRSVDPITGCVGATPPRQCPIDAAEEHIVGHGSRLLSAPTVRLTLGSKAVISGRGAPRLDEACENAPCVRFRLHRWLTWLIYGFLTLVALSGLALVTMREDPNERMKVQRWTKRLALAAGFIVLSLWALPQLVIFLNRGRSLLQQRAGVLTGASTGTILVALVAQLGAASGKTTSPVGKVQGLLNAVGRRLRPLLLRIATWLAGPALLVLIAILFAAYGASLRRDYAQITFGLVIVGWLLIFGSCGDLNRWSLHGYYRERLRSAFAEDSAGTRPDEALAELPHAATDLQLVMCATANLADDRVTPPGRPALPWAFASGEMGSCPGTGCYDPAELPARFSELGKVWTSVAVSGAAFSPAMGKMSRPERFLFALGNLRLGIWYPNPLYFQPGGRRDFDRSWYEWHHPRPWYLFKEALGLHKLSDPWVYVTDGGHYENLGLVELLRKKKCPEVYCFDAAGDSTSTFGTLADAMRLAREEHEIEIRLDPRAMESDDDGCSHVGVWAGTVKYPDASMGWIVVAKLTVPKSAPFDVVDLARTLPSFPTHPTADQLYTDQKFEAYRALGHHLGREAVALGTKIRSLIESKVDLQKAVDQANKALCDEEHPHPCPPEKEDDGAEKKVASRAEKKVASGAEKKVASKAGEKSG